MKDSDQYISIALHIEVKVCLNQKSVTMKLDINAQHE